MHALEISALTKSFDGIRVLDSISIAVKKGEFFGIVGPTNAGKSTLLKLVAGLYRPDAGTIAIKGRDVTTAGPAERHVSLMFQNVALFPMLNGFDNIAFPLRQAGIGVSAVEERVKAVATMLGLNHLLDRLPRTYSGGEKQRTALGRALIHPGNVLMLDEPLTNLDARLRISLRVEFKKLHQQTGQTTLYVTHDQREAMSLSDRIAVLKDGQLQQLGPPEELYRRPVNRFVATFIGSPPMNIFDADVCRMNDGFHLVGEGFDIGAPGMTQEPLCCAHRQVAVGIRPEDVHVALLQTKESSTPAELTWVERLGDRNILTIRLGHNLLKVLCDADRPLPDEGQVWIGFTAGKVHFLDRRSGRFFQSDRTGLECQSAVSGMAQT